MQLEVSVHIQEGILFCKQVPHAVGQLTIHNRYIGIHTDGAYLAQFSS